jgi:two-component system response regulator YcbB
MKYYILDDDINVCRKISQIIDEEQLGTVVNSSQDPVKSLSDFDYFDIDIMVVDLLMPELDGINFIKRAKAINEHVEFIMVSQVNRKEMISKAYESGVRYFINKPINKIEVKNVIRNVSELVNYRKKFNFLGEMFSKVNTETKENSDIAGESMRRALIEIGVWGEKGAAEILETATYISNHKIHMAEVSLKDIFKEMSGNPQNYEQRIRRAINKGMTNLASIGIEDNLNSTFIQFSNTLYDFESIQKEMESLRGKCDKGGKVNLRKFIDNLLTIPDEK